MSSLLERSRDRRGVLLLLVLSMLTLFLMLGAVMLVMATRARTSARAFANATTTAAVPTLQAQAALDEALMVLLRGSKDSTVTLKVTESILHDKYGLPLVSSGSATINRNAADPLPTATLVGGGADARKLFGRVITFLPRAAEQMNPVSFRIVGASGNTVYLANVPFRPSLKLSGTYAIRINGREFTDEAHDSPATDSWLTQCVVSSGTIASVRQAACQNGQPLACDNDNDGVADGVFLDGVIADRPSPNGGTLQYRVSYLVLDLDGRVNVNAAGMPDRALGSYAGTPDVPLGMGYGPADLDPSLVVSSTPSLPVGGLSAFTGSGTVTPTDLWYSRFLSGDPTTTTEGTATALQRRPSPAILTLGRYGRNGRPGITADDVVGNQQTTASSTNAARYDLTIAGTNAVADLKGQMRVYMRPPTAGQITPTLTFFVAQSGTDAADDPYEARLDAGGPRPGTAMTGTSPGNDDNPFTVADMERVLRANDPDASTLPPRLAAGLANVAQASRMRITTDSWDTPALTGSAATMIENKLSGAAVGAIAYPWVDTNAASPDVAAGLRFNLNRPVSTAAHAQEYCKGLYTLAVKLGENPAKAAQWAVNVLDFRDGDSTMTAFEYDTNLANGWNVDGDAMTTNDPDRGIVWGVERPDLLIAETAAWRETQSGSSQLLVNLIRPPWNAVVMTGTGAAAASVERLDPGLGISNSLSIGAGPVWQLRFDTDAVVQFTAVNGPTTQSQQVLTGTGLRTSTSAVCGGTTAVPGISPGGQCIVSPAGPQWFTWASATGTCVVTQGGQFAPAAGGAGRVWLERLADPSRPNGIGNPYVVVDSAPVKVCEYAAGSPTIDKRSRPSSGQDLTAFWKSPAAWDPSPSAAVGAYVVSGTAPWFHWPNRPFVSQAELALVPADGPQSVLANYSFPTTSLAATPGSLLLDATHVPTRFAGCAISLATLASGTICGLDRLNANHFSTWREPGRVNVNTIPSGTANVVDTDSLVWSTLIGGTALPLASGTLTINPFVSSGTAAPSPARSTAQLLSLSGSAGQPIATGTFASGTVNGMRDENPFFAYATAIRLANTATVRSNVFAVWITVEVRDTSANAPSPTYRRMFAIVDRSIPVGYSPGENLNVRDTIRLQRYLD